MSNNNTIDREKRNAIRLFLNVLNGELGYEDMRTLLTSVARMPAEDLRRRTLFNWSHVPGDTYHLRQFRDFLVRYLEIMWAEDAEITSSADHKVIQVVKDENTVTMKIDKDMNGRMTLNIDDEETPSWKVKMENNIIKIYGHVQIQDMIEIIKTNRWNKKWCW